MWIKKYVSSLSRYNNDKWRIRAISEYFQSSEAFESVFSFMSLSTETIPFNKKWNSVTNLLQPFMTYSSYGLEYFFLSLAPSPHTPWSEEKHRSHDMKIEMAYNEIFVLAGVFAVSTPGCCPCSPQCAEGWPWPRGCGRAPFPLFARRSFSICCACSWAPCRSGFCLPLPAHGDLDL